MFIFYSNKYALNAFEVEFYFRCKCKGMQRICVFVYLQEGKNHEKQFLQGVFMTGKSNFSNIFCIKAAKVRKSTADNHADELHVLIEIALLHGSLL